ncbi:hypothetical protein [Listeria ilorinensis]|uniref:hypothetical protein n=1 Tax=Listeria ilorinensis TaxID=2867439 RepID=UPI001EF50184|nr:hypothetical protein [Listeria ilorinensis]
MIKTQRTFVNEKRTNFRAYGHTKNTADFLQAAIEYTKKQIAEVDEEDELEVIIHFACDDATYRELRKLTDDAYDRESAELSDLYTTINPYYQQMIILTK